MLALGVFIGFNIWLRRKRKFLLSIMRKKTIELPNKSQLEKPDHKPLPHTNSATDIDQSQMPFPVSGGQYLSKVDPNINPNQAVNEFDQSQRSSNTSFSSISQDSFMISNSYYSSSGSGSCNTSMDEKPLTKRTAGFHRQKDHAFVAHYMS